MVKWVWGVRCLLVCILFAIVNGASTEAEEGRSKELRGDSCGEQSDLITSSPYLDSAKRGL